MQYCCTTLSCQDYGEMFHPTGTTRSCFLELSQSCSKDERCGARNTPFPPRYVALPASSCVQYAHKRYVVLLTNVRLEGGRRCCAACSAAPGDRGQNAASLCLCVCLTIVNRDTGHMRCHHLSPLSLSPSASLRSSTPAPPFL